MDFPIHLTSQLREHLRALRKARGLTQAALGRLLGVGQARVAEIESNPGVVSVDQLMKVLSALRASMVLREGAIEATAERALAVASPPSPPASKSRKLAKHTSTGKVGRQAAPVLASRTKAKSPSAAPAPQDANPGAKAPPPSKRKVVIQPKKGSW